MVDGKDGTRWAGFYNWATTVHPGKPLMLAEWGVTETSDPNAKANFFNNMPNLEKSYPAIKALDLLELRRLPDADRLLAAEPRRLPGAGAEPDVQHASSV